MSTTMIRTVFGGSLRLTVTIVCQSDTSAFLSNSIADCKTEGDTLPLATYRVAYIFK